MRVGCRLESMLSYFCGVNSSPSECHVQVDVVLGELPQSLEVEEPPECLETLDVI